MSFRLHLCQEDLLSSYLHPDSSTFQKRPQRPNGTRRVDAKYALDFEGLNLENQCRHLRVLCNRSETQDCLLPHLHVSKGKVASGTCCNSTIKYRFYKKNSIQNLLFKNAYIFGYILGESIRAAFQ